MSGTARRGSVTGRSLFPTLVQGGKYVLLRADMRVSLIDSENGATVRKWQFRREILAVKPVRKSHNY